MEITEFSGGGRIQSSDAVKLGQTKLGGPSVVRFDNSIELASADLRAVGGLK